MSVLDDVQRTITAEDMNTFNQANSRPDRVGTFGKAGSAAMGGTLGVCAARSFTKQETFLGSEGLGQMIYGKTTPSIAKTIGFGFAGTLLGIALGASAYNGGQQDIKNRYR